MALLTASASAVARSPFCWPIAPEGAFCKPEEDPFLLLESSLKAIERILRRRRGLPLRRHRAHPREVADEISRAGDQLQAPVGQALGRQAAEEVELIAFTPVRLVRWRGRHQRAVHRCAGPMGQQHGGQRSLGPVD